MTFIERCIRRPVGVAVVVLLVMIFGIIGLLRAPVQLTPNVDQPIVTVTTNWFGASPQEMVREVAEEQEKVLKNVSGLREMTSNSVEGETQIRLEFFVGVDKEAALNEVRDKLRQVPDYPPDVDEPTVEAVDRFSRDYIAWMLLRQVAPIGASGPPAEGYRGNVNELETWLRDFVEPVLERAVGVSEVQVLGGRERECQIRVDLVALAGRGIGIERLIAALRDANLDVTAGTVPEGKRDVSVRVTGQYENPEQIRQTVIAYASDRSPVYVRDVADVVVDFKKESGFVRSLGEPVIAINAQREVGTNVLEVMGNLKAALREVNDNVLGPTNWGLHIDQVYDQTVYIEDAVSQARGNLAVGAALAGLVLLVTLRSLGATAVIMLAVPIATIGTFLGMAIFGRSLNVISMAGLTFAVGMGIDNAIVVLENIFRHREMGKDRLRAAVDGTIEVGGAILASTLTNVAVFLPIIFIQEEAGQLFRDLSVALTIAFFLYLFVAPTVVPVLATLLLRNVPESQRSLARHERPTTAMGRLTAPVGRATRALSQGFYQFVLWLTGHAAARLALVAALMAAGVFLTYRLIPPVDYLPTGNQNLLFGFVLTPPGYNTTEFRDLGGVIESRLSPWWEAKGKPEELRALREAWSNQRDQQVAALQQQIEGMSAGMRQQGMSDPQIAAATDFQRETLAALRDAAAPPAIDNFFFVNFRSNVFMGATSADRFEVKPLQFLFNDSVHGIPGTFGIFAQASIFRLGGTGSELNLTILGDRNEDVVNAASAVFGSIMQNLGTFPRPDPANFNLGRTEVAIRPDYVRAGAAGVSPASIRDLVQASVDGRIIGEYRERGRSIDLTVMSNLTREEQFTEQLRDLPVARGDGAVVPLASVAEFRQTLAPQQINRFNEQPAVTFSVQVPKGQTLQEATAALQARVIDPLVQAGVIGRGVGYRLTGSADKLVRFRNAFLPGFFLAAAVTYLLLAALFESWVMPLVIILSVPFALVGGFLGMAMLHAYNPESKLDVLTMLGFVILVGTIINNPILIVHQALNNLREGMGRREAVARSTQTRVRPIFMSVTTTVAGLAPLVVVGGAGSELYRGLGAVIIGGLVLSTAVTLILTPALLSLTLDIQSGLGGLVKGRARRSQPEPDAEVERREPVGAARRLAPEGGA